MAAIFLFTLLSLPLAYSFPCFGLLSSPSKDAIIKPNPPNGHWVDTWTSMPQLTEFSNLPPPPFNSTDLVFYNTTIRQTLHITTPISSHLRISVSNAFSPVDLPITSMTIAIPLAAGNQNLTGSSFINTTTLQHVIFSGNKSSIVPPGALAVSDPIAFPVRTNAVLSISMYLAEGQASQLITSHPGSRTSSWISFGDHTSSPNMTDPSTQESFHWFFLSSVQAWSPPSTSSFVILGDSLTDGRGSYNNANQRWPDLLFNRLSHLGTNIAVANQAAGGNKVLYDGNGPNLVSRIDRDVLAHPNVKYVMVWEGVNDIGTADATVQNQTETGERLIEAYKQIITRMHGFGIPVFGGTITPFGCANSTVQPYSDSVREGTRQKVNKWIRKSGWFDEVMDFDQVVRDPRNETRLRPEWDLGDCLHLNGEGYEALAESFPVDVFQKFEDGVGTFM